ncbi:hypothetical protein D3C73_864450 [compost metagenome]
MLLKSENRPLTPKDLGNQPPSERQPESVIMDGEMVKEGLAKSGKNIEWLHTELDKLGVTLDNVFVGQVDAYGDLYVDLFNDQIKVPIIQQRPLLLAKLKRCEADLEIFALSTNNQQAKAVYAQCAKEMLQVIHRVKSILQN